MSKFLFSGRRQSTHSCHSDMGLSFPKPDSRDVLQTIPCSHSILISEWQHTNRKRPAVLVNQLALPANFGHTGDDPSKGAQ